MNPSNPIPLAPVGNGGLPLGFWALVGLIALILAGSFSKQPEPFETPPTSEANKVQPHSSQESTSKPVHGETGIVPEVIDSRGSSLQREGDKKKDSGGTCADGVGSNGDDEDNKRPRGQEQGQRSQVWERRITVNVQTTSTNGVDTGSTRADEQIAVEITLTSTTTGTTFIDQLWDATERQLSERGRLMSMTREEFAERQQRADGPLHQFYLAREQAVQQELSPSEIATMLASELQDAQNAYDSRNSLNWSEYRLTQATNIIVQAMRILLRNGYSIQRDANTSDLYLNDPSGRTILTLNSNLPEFLDARNQFGGELRSQNSPNTGHDGRRSFVQVEVNSGGFRFRSHGGNRNVIYGIRCVTTNSDIVYVGLTSQTIDARAQQHARSFGSNKGRMVEYIGQNAPQHLGGSFWDMFNIFVLDQLDESEEKLLRDFELFWQWLLRVLQHFGGASDR